jgi:hypothetical protein
LVHALWVFMGSYVTKLSVSLCVFVPLLSCESPQTISSDTHSCKRHLLILQYQRFFSSISEGPAPFFKYHFSLFPYLQNWYRTWIFISRLITCLFEQNPHITVQVGLSFLPAASLDYCNIGRSFAPTTFPLFQLDRWHRPSTSSIRWLF